MDVSFPRPKALDAGYMEDWRCNKTLSGVPQGSILSPPYSPISSLNRLDRFVETNSDPRYNEGKKRTGKSELSTPDKMQSTPTKGRKDTQRRLRKDQPTSTKTSLNRSPDPSYRRLKTAAMPMTLPCLRGSKAEARNIKQRHLNVPAHE